MSKFYSNVEQEILDFIHRCRDTTTTSSSVPCLTTISLDTFTLAIEHLHRFLQFLLTYTPDVSIDFHQLISIVSNCSELMNYIDTYQYLFIEYAIDDYLLLDEHFNEIYENVIKILECIRHLPTINSEIYHLDKELRLYLPLTYSRSLSTQIVSTLIDQTSRLFSSSYNSLSNDTEDDDNNDNHNTCIMSSSFLFSSSPLIINYDNDNKMINLNHSDSFNESRSMIQLDKINIRTTSLTHSQLTPSFQFDLTEFEQIENDLDQSSDWMKIEREVFHKMISVWSHENLTIQTINPWSSETFWILIMHFKCSDMNLKYEFILIIQWCFCLLAIQAFNRDWDLLFSKTLTNTIMNNRWRTIYSSKNIHVSAVGHHLNQMFLRLIRIVAILQYMKILADQSSYLTSYFINLISVNINMLTQQIEGTFHLLLIWLNQHADAFINADLLERALLICTTDHMQISKTIAYLANSLRQLKDCQQPITSITKLHSSCQTIVNDTISKLYRRIHINASQYFTNKLPLTANEWRLTYQQTSYMITACDKLLKSIISQIECLHFDTKFNIYENVLSAFVQAWIMVLLERKYRFCDDMVNILQKDHEYLQTFLSENITDEETVQALNQSQALQEIASIIKLLKTGDRNESLPHIPNQDKWLQSRKSSSSFFECFQQICCCQRRNRVTTGLS
ncbi:unnamed protein product [Adineta ricciae]|uniref:Uncharacterized protein n=1 Tax=Adineta ricciae TaxID=249248 RepID=A0A813QC88_ADIRI|nr:unnamed protein product [Adineta ricciae]CAF0919581.1 unnamed protein product [Adineta ricciae]